MTSPTIMHPEPLIELSPDGSFGDLGVARGEFSDLRIGEVGAARRFGSHRPYRRMGRDAVAAARQPVGEERQNGGAAAQRDLSRQRTRPRRPSKERHLDAEARLRALVDRDRNPTALIQRLQNTPGGVRSR